MGTTLTAIVEWREPDDTHPRPWWRLATWRLGKDHSLMAVLSEHACCDWPLDAAERDAAKYDFHRYWTSGIIAAAVITNMPEPSPFATSLAESLYRLVNTGHLRVLWLEI